MTSITKKYARIRELKQNGTKVQVNESTPAGTRRCAHAKSPPQQISFEVLSEEFPSFSQCKAGDSGRLGNRIDQTKRFDYHENRGSIYLQKGGNNLKLGR